MHHQHHQWKLPGALLIVLSLVLLWNNAGGASAADIGYQPEVTVKQPTRLDWEFVASAFGKDALQLPASFDSADQKYQLFVPKNYVASKNWPLIVFVSPGDDPLGWKYWQKVCEEHDVLYCAAYGAGNSCPAGKRIRVVLDVFDDVRRQYRIDPDRTYITGFSGGGRMACTIGFALPEYFGGIIAICGTNPLPKLDYLRHRVRDRVSIAFLTGTNDFNRKESEDFMFPLLQDISIRSRLWVVPKLGHAVPGPDELTDALNWLESDLKRRRTDAAERPGIAASSSDVPTSLSEAQHQLDAAENDLKIPNRTFRAVALLQGINSRWSNTEPAEKARVLLKTIADDPRRARLIAEQGGAEERQLLAAQARALEKFGEMRAALKAWDLLAKNHQDTDEGKRAAEQGKRIRAELASSPYLGITFDGASTTVQAVETKGPADHAGVQPGDKLARLGTTKVATLPELRTSMKAFKPGDSVEIEVQRKGKTLVLTAEVGKTPAE
jgi:hypothetical protein